MDIIKKNSHIINNNNTGNSIVELSKMIEADGSCWQAYMERGKHYWREGDFKSALNDYIIADSLNPNSTPRELIEHTLEIIQFRNNDILNP